MNLKKNYYKLITITITYMVKTLLDKKEMIDDNSLLEYLKSRLDEEELKIFATSFYMYLKCDNEKDFIIELDDIYGWLGYERKEKCKALLMKTFTEDIDYIEIRENDIISGENFALPPDKAKKEKKGKKGQENLTVDTNSAVVDEENFATPIGVAKKEKKGKKDQENLTVDTAENRGGSNKIPVLLTVDCFKGLCMAAPTDQGKMIRKYYLKLEKLNIDYSIIQESNKTILAVAKEKERHLATKHQEQSCVYWLINPLVKLLKFGSTNNLTRRLKEHKSGDFKDNFTLDKVIQSDKYSNLENSIRKYQNTTYNEHIEIIKYDDYKEVEKIYKSIEKESDALGTNSIDQLEFERIKLAQEHEIARKIEAQEITKRIETQEITKRIETQELTKRIEAQEQTKQMQIQLDIRKFNLSSPKKDARQDNHSLDHSLVDVSINIPIDNASIIGAPIIDNTSPPDYSSVTTRDFFDFFKENIVYSSESKLQVNAIKNRFNTGRVDIIKKVSPGFYEKILTLNEKFKNHRDTNKNAGRKYFILNCDWISNRT